MSLPCSPVSCKSSNINDVSEDLGPGPAGRMVARLGCRRSSGLNWRSGESDCPPPVGSSLSPGLHSLKLSLSSSEGCQVSSQQSWKHFISTQRLNSENKCDFSLQLSTLLHCCALQLSRKVTHKKCRYLYIFDFYGPGEAPYKEDIVVI